jgi:hypothetical protein
MPTSFDTLDYAPVIPRTDRLATIKARLEYASQGEPGRGQEDAYWLVREVDRLRAELAEVAR